MLQKLPKFLEVAQKTASCQKVAEQLEDRATFRKFLRTYGWHFDDLNGTTPYLGNSSDPRVRACEVENLVATFDLF